MVLFRARTNPVERLARSPAPEIPPRRALLAQLALLPFPAPLGLAATTVAELSQLADGLTAQPAEPFEDSGKQRSVHCGRA